MTTHTTHHDDCGCLRARIVAMLKAKADYYDHEAHIETDVSLRAMFFARSATIESCILMIEEMKS